MRSDRIEAIFQRDLDRLPGLSDDEWIPRKRPSSSRLTLREAVGVTLVALAIAVVTLSVQAVRDAQVAEEDTANTLIPFVTEGQGAAAPSASASPVASLNAWLTGAPVCPPGQILGLDITQPPPPGSVPGTGASGPEEAFRRAYPSVTDFKMYPMGKTPGSSVWIVAGDQTYVAYWIGSPANLSWFAYPARVVACRTPINQRTGPPATNRPGTSPAVAPKSVG
jgi:hypothetical protein